MLDLLKKFEKGVTVTLVVLMALVVLLATIELGWIIIKDIITPPAFLLEIDELLDIFGLFLLVLIGVELLDTIRAYLREHVVHVEVVLEVALIAVARKIIILELKETPSLSLVGIAALVAALAAAFYLEKRGRRLVQKPAANAEPE